MLLRGYRRGITVDERCRVIMADALINQTQFPCGPAIIDAPSQTIASRTTLRLLVRWGTMMVPVVLRVLVVLVTTPCFLAVQPREVLHPEVSVVRRHPPMVRWLPRRVLIVAVVLVPMAIGCLGGCSIQPSADPTGERPPETLPGTLPDFAITSNGETVTPYENLLWSETWTDESGWVSADSESVFEDLEAVLNQLPTIVLREDVDLVRGDQRHTCLPATIWQDCCYHATISDNPCVCARVPIDSCSGAKVSANCCTGASIRRHYLV